MNHNIADLGAVAVGYDYFVFVYKIGDNLSDFCSYLFLSFGGRFAVLLKGVTSER